MPFSNERSNSLNDLPAVWHSCSARWPDSIEAPRLVRPERACYQGATGSVTPEPMDTQDKLYQIRLPSRKGRKVPPAIDAEGKILDAAEFVFGHFGLRGASTALIATKAGVAKAHMYYYFEDKEDLYRAVLERAMTMWARDIGNLDATTDLRTVLRDYIHRKVEFSRDHPFLSRIYASEVISGAPFIGGFIEKVSTPQLLEKVAMVETWAEQGLIKPISPADLFFCIWAMTQAYADFASQMAIMKTKRQLAEADYDAAKATIVQLVFGGLGLAFD